MPIPGFDAPGRLAPGQLSQSLTPINTGSQWVDPVRRAGITVAVVATAFAGFVPPPANAAQSIFSTFSQPGATRAMLPDEQSSALFETAPVVIPFAGFMEFGLPRFARYNFSDQQTSTLFEVEAAPTAAPFAGFADFGTPRFVRYNFAGQQDVLFEVVFVPPAQGGGTSRKLPDPQRIAEPSRRKGRTGLEPVKKLPPRKIETVEPSIPLPPPSFIRPAPDVAKQIAPLELVDRDLIPHDLLGLQAQIHGAEDATDLQDILDVIAFLDSSST